MSSDSWKFEELKFPKPDYQSFEAMNKDAIRRIEEAESGGDVLEVIFENNELARRANDLLEVALVRQSIDTTDEKYNREAKWVHEHKPFFSKATVEFNEAVYKSPFKDYIVEKLGSMYFTKMEIEEKIFCEENIPLLKREAELSADYQRIMASCQAEIQGEKKSFMMLQKLFTHEDRDVRKAAFKAFSGFLSENEDRLNEIWDELITVRNEMGRNLGYDNYLPVAYLKRGRIDYGPDEVANFRKQVLEEIVPFCMRLFEAQAKKLGIEKIMAYDEAIIFPDGNAKPVGDVDFMMKQVVNMFRDMSPETDEFISFMLDHQLIDYGNRPGKAAREYSTIIHSKKAPFIFSFFDGTAKGLKNLVGSLGHAFATYRSSRKQPIDVYYSSSADIMEIHVMTMTQFSNQYAESFFGEDAKKYPVYNLHDLMTFIPFGVAVDEFQHICYSHPELSPRERNLEWKKLEEKYMPWRKYEDDDDFMNSGGYWYHKQHIFLYPLYYIEYPFATINSMEMLGRYVDKPEIAWRQYLNLADLGGSKRYLETLQIAGITPPFEDGAVAKSISYAKSVLEEYIQGNI